MTGLERLREDLARPELTEEEAVWLLCHVESTQLQFETAWLRWNPKQVSLSTGEIAKEQDCSREPVALRLRKWLSRARVVLGNREEEEG